MSHHARTVARKTQHLVEGAPDLEGAGRLERFRLQQELGVAPLDTKQRGTNHVGTNQGGGIPDRIEADLRNHGKKARGLRSFAGRYSSIT